MQCGWEQQGPGSKVFVTAKGGSCSGAGGDRAALAPPKIISTEVELSLTQGVPEPALCWLPSDPGGDTGDSPQ